MRSLRVVLLVVVLASPAYARETDHTFSIQEDLESELGRDRLFAMPFYFWGQDHPGILEEISVERSNRHTRGLFRSDRDACQVAFLSAIRQLQVRAERLGADAIVDIKSVTRHKDLESSTEYRCVAGTMVVHVGLEGRLVRFSQEAGE